MNFSQGLNLVYVRSGRFSVEETKGRGLAVNFACTCASMPPEHSANPPSSGLSEIQGCLHKDLPIQQILSLEKAQRMAEFFGVLGDPNRWRILSALALQSMCVRDLAAAVEMTDSAVSHQLRILRTMRLVRYVKQGRNVIYCLKDQHIFNLYREASEHLDEPDD